MQQRFTLAICVITVLLTVFVFSYRTISISPPLIIYQNRTEYKHIIVDHTIYVNRTIYVNNTIYIDANTTNITTTSVISQTAPSVVSVQPFISALAISQSEQDISDQWQDDDGNLRYVTLMYKPAVVADDLNNIRRLVGSIHHFENEKIKTTIFGYAVPEDFYHEIRTFSHVRYIEVPYPLGESVVNAHAYVIDTSRRLYAKFLYIDSSQKLMLNNSLSGLLAQENRRGKIQVIRQRNLFESVYGFIRDGEEGLTINFEGNLQIFEKDDQFGRCSLQRNISSPYRTKSVFIHHNSNFLAKETRHNADGKLICISIATYSGDNTSIDVESFSLMSKVLPSFLISTESDDTPTSRFRFAMYLGLQRDAFYDNPVKFEELKNKIINRTNDRSFSLRIFYTPLNAPTMDITYKWNALIDQSYRDMCDYIYQYSDDTIFLTPWVSPFVNYLEAESNFGIVGATDRNNPAVMTLSFAHRNHISILGTFWPTHFKNWYSDIWAQFVYGRRYSKHFADVLIKNTQQQGQRYSVCGHGALNDRITKEESRPRFIEWLLTQPQTYDVRQKLEYYQVKGAEGDKRK